MQPMTCARPLPGRRTALAALLAALLLAGCGGSGSSGFDALAAENAAIDRALATMDCTVEQGLTICASTVVEAPAAPTPTPTRTPTPLHTPATSASPTRTAEAEPSRTATAAADRAAGGAAAEPGLARGLRLDRPAHRQPAGARRSDDR